MTAAEFEPLLTEDELAAHAADEAVIAPGLRTFAEVGGALARIRDRGSYRATHGTFAAYCLDRWGLQERRAQQLMVAAETRTIVPVSNEGQARELSRYPDEHKPAVWEKAKEVAAGRGAPEVTAGDLKKVTFVPGFGAFTKEELRGQMAEKLREENEADAFAEDDLDDDEDDADDEEGDPDPPDPLTPPLPLDVSEPPAPQHSLLVAAAAWLEAGNDYQLGLYRSAFKRSALGMFGHLAKFNVNELAERATREELDVLDRQVRLITDYHRRLVEAMPRSLRGIAGGA